MYDTTLNHILLDNNCYQEQQQSNQRFQFMMDINSRCNNMLIPVSILVNNV